MKKNLVTAFFLTSAFLNMYAFSGAAYAGESVGGGDASEASAYAEIKTYKAKSTARGIYAYACTEAAKRAKNMALNDCYADGNSSCTLPSSATLSEGYPFLMTYYKCTVQAVSRGN